MNKLPIPLESWAIVESVSTPSWSRLEPGRRLTGWTSSHENLPAGLIYTSAIVRVDEAKGLMETRNTLYRLDRCNPDYETWLRQSASRAA